MSAMFVARVHGNAADEVKRLAALMEWKPGTIAADIGAGDGKYTFAAVERVGASGKVYATEIERKKLEELEGEVAKRKRHGAYEETGVWRTAYSPEWVAAQDLVDLALSPAHAGTTGWFFKGGRRIEPPRSTMNVVHQAELWKRSAELVELESGF